MDKSSQSQNHNPQSHNPSSVDAKTEEISQDSYSSDLTSGVMPLVFPSTVRKSNRDSNKGLYPQSVNKFHSHQLGSSPGFPCFSKASDIYNVSKSDNLFSQCHHFTSKRLKQNRLNRLRKPLDVCRLSANKSSHKLSCVYFDFVPNQSQECAEQLVLKHKNKKRKIGRVDSLKHTLHEYYRTSSEHASRAPVQEENSPKETSATEVGPSVITHGAQLHNDDVYTKAFIVSAPTRCSDESNKMTVQERTSESSCDSSELFPSAHKEVSDVDTEEKDNCFGLLGAADKSKDDTDQTNYFEQLPVAVMEQILCNLPLVDLMKLCSVCRSWNSIISNEKFVQWKKAYYRLKMMGNCESSFPVNGLPQQLWRCSVDECFPFLIRYMSCDYSRRSPSEMMNILQKLPKYGCAVSVIKERLPDVASKSFNPWGTIAVLVVISETVDEVLSVLKCLLAVGSPCSPHDVFDALYCIATFLLFFKNHYRINHGIHYRIYYALYLVENSIPQESVLEKTAMVHQTGQQSMHNYWKPVEQHLTYEQIRILNHRLQPNQVVKIVAFAGSGKTSTLIHFSRMHPQLKFLNVVFNRSVSEHASKCFPPNVDCRTAHSLAYQAIGKMYRHKFAYKLKPHDVLPILNKPESMSMHIFAYAKYVLQTVENFMMSADEDITLSHVPVYSSASNSTVHAVATRECLTDSERLILRQEAENLWSRMIDINDKHCKLTHDAYLKLFHLSKPKFNKYNCIMIDEAQDCNAAMLGIMLSQNVPAILVGDPHQQIYSFRGANNALENVNATHTYHLTKSFRFGPEIAYVASCCLEVLKHHSRTTLVGCDKTTFIDGRTMGQYAVIARTNFRLFEEAVRLCCTSNRQNGEPETVYAAFAGGISGYGFDQLADIYRLASREELEKIKDKFVKRFSSFGELSSYAKKAEDTDLQAKVELVIQHGHKILEYVRTIKKKGCYSVELANVIFSTAHKAKGLEFDTVFLANDFNVEGIFSERPRRSCNLSEEYNILYVALTRAKQCLLMSEALYKVVVAAQEKFEFPVSTMELQTETFTLRCVSCSAEFIPHTVLSTVRREVTLASGRKIKGGALCKKCATAPYYRPEIHHPAAVMFLDPVEDNGHQSMCSLVGPLASDPPIRYDDASLPEEVAEPHFVFHINIPH